MHIFALFYITQDQLKKPVRNLTHFGSRTVHADGKVRLNNQESDDDSDYEKDEVYKMKRADEVYPVKGKSGLFYKVSFLMGVLSQDFATGFATGIRHWIIASICIGSVLLLEIQ